MIVVKYLFASEATKLHHSRERTNRNADAHAMRNRATATAHKPFFNAPEPGGVFYGLGGASLRVAGRAVVELAAGVAAGLFLARGDGLGRRRGQAPGATLDFEEVDGQFDFGHGERQKKRVYGHKGRQGFF